MKAWPHYRDTRDDHRYKLVMFATDQDDRLVYVLSSRSGGLNITSTPPGSDGSVIEIDRD